MSEEVISSQNMIEKDDSVLVVIDVQEKLMPVIADAKKSD